MRRRGHSGFTLVELMVVIAIIAIASAVAVSAFKSDPVPEASRSVAALLNEARRRAVGGGALRPDVAAALATRARTRVEIKNTSDVSSVRLEVLVEDPLPANTGSWVLIGQLSFASVKIYKVNDVAESLPGATLPVADLVPGTPELREYYPDGTSEATTLYLGKRIGVDSSKRYRVFVFPVSAIAAAGINW